jgi:hypothetical protein
MGERIGLHGVACMHSCMPGETEYACYATAREIVGDSDWVGAKTHSMPGLSAWMLALL